MKFEPCFINFLAEVFIGSHDWASHHPAWQGTCWKKKW